MLKNSLRLFLSLSIAALAVPANIYGQNALPGIDYSGLILEKINSYLIYPPEATQNGWEGIVKVRFVLTPDGRVRDIDIAESSGYPLLDAAAMLAVKDAGPYPFPVDYETDELEITLPVTYSQQRLNVYSEEAYPQETAEQADQQQAAAAEPSQDQYPPDRVPQKPEPYSIQEGYTGKVVLPKNEELRNLIEIALKNNQPTKVAKEEVEAAKLKITEAKRSFFPGVRITTYNTQGNNYDIDFTEREAKINIEQPIYYGNRLNDTLSQAKVSLEIAQRNYDRLRIDVMQKTEVAYYNLLAARQNLKEKECIAQEAQGLYEKVQKLVSAGLAIALEATSSKAWYDKIRFQVDSVKQDLLMAELTLRQVLNVQETPAIKGDLPQPKKLELTFEQCQELALNNRPEIYLSQLTVKYSEYGLKIEKDKSKFTVDLNGGLGYYQSRYRTEDFKGSGDWSIGLKASKPLGASTSTHSLTHQNSKKALGQTTPTSGTTLSSEFGFLDNFKRLSDYKKAEIDLQKSLSDFNEATKTVGFEVQDAFLNYQKAVLQLGTALGDMNFRRSEAEITKIRAQVNEANLSNALESLYNFAEAQTNYIQAIANYSISLANIKKSTGYSVDI